jgi:serine phosphatase RsbU (regulator of sigma subunit)
VPVDSGESSEARPADGRLPLVVDRLRSELRALRVHTASRSVVDVAKGVLVERLHCGPAEAAEQLARLAAASNLSLVDWAAEVINQAAGDSLTTAADTGDDLLDPAITRRLRIAEAAMLAAPDADDLARSLLGEALAPLGAVAVALWVLQPDGALELAGRAGLDAAEAGRWRRLPPQLDSLPQRVARLGQPQWLSSGVPGGDPVPTLGGRPTAARAVLPMIERSTLLGVAEICWPEPRDGFPTGERKQLAACADTCARALGGDTRPARPDGHLDSARLWLAGVLDGLMESVLLARPVRDDEGNVVDFYIDHVNRVFTDPAGRGQRELIGRHLLEVYPTDADRRGLYDVALRALTEPLAPAPTGIVLTAVDNGVPHSASVTVSGSRCYDGVLLCWQPDVVPNRLSALPRQAQWLGQMGGFEQNLTTGKTTWTEYTYALFGMPPDAEAIALDRLRTRAHPHDGPLVGEFLRTVLRDHQASTVTCRMIRADGATRRVRVFAEPVIDALGNLTHVHGAYQDVSAQYHAGFALAATQDRLVDTEQRAEDEHRLARRLQRVIMPAADPPVDVAGLRLAARLRPASGYYQVGGDWYDAVALPSGPVLLTVGDVVGHGVDAATGMVALRNALRGLAITGAPPAQLLAWLNTAAMAEGLVGTLICGLYEPGTRMLTWARAGHLPPLLVRDGTAKTLPVPRGMMLGASGAASYEQTEMPLTAGDTLLMFTDGVIERRASDLDIGMDDLLRNATALAAETGDNLDDYCDRLLAASASDTHDDACLITIRVT